MNSIIERIEERYINILPYSYKIAKTDVDLDSPDFLENLKNSAFFSFLNQDLAFCEQILYLFTNLPYDGNSDKWTWIELGIGLRMYIDIQNENFAEYNELKSVIYNKFEYIGLPESTRKINLKAFTRRLSGSSLLVVKERIDKYKEEENIKLEFMYLTSYYSELVFIYSMNEGDVDDNIKEELNSTKDRLLEIIDYYKKNP